MDNFIPGVCCEYCAKEATKKCIVESANKWSRYKNFCSEFINENNENISKVIEKQILSVINEDNIRCRKLKNKDVLCFLII